VWGGRPRPPNREEKNAWRSTGRPGIPSPAEAEFAALDVAKNIEDTGARLRTLLGFEGNPAKGDKAGAFLWSALSDLWTYSANRVPEISNSIVEIDRAMRLGFNGNSALSNSGMPLASRPQSLA